MKNTASATHQPVSKKTAKEHVQPVRVSDMGIRMKVTGEGEKKQPVATAV